MGINNIACLASYIKALGGPSKGSHETQLVNARSMCIAFLHSGSWYHATAFKEAFSNFHSPPCSGLLKYLSRLKTEKERDREKEFEVEDGDEG